MVAFSQGDTGSRLLFGFKSSVEGLIKTHHYWIGKMCFRDNDNRWAFYCYARNTANISKGGSFIWRKEINYSGAQRSRTILKSLFFVHSIKRICYLKASHKFWLNLCNIKEREPSQWQCRESLISWPDLEIHPLLTFTCTVSESKGDFLAVDLAFYPYKNDMILIETG